jgi:glycosyltransferase involved in cell wall biosynthesis
MSERKKILWLVSWYPNKYDPFDGDFIQRHAEAAARYDDIHVLFLKQSEHQTEIEVAEVTQNGLKERLVYLPLKRGAINKIANHLHWHSEYKKQASKIITELQPHLIHVHVPWKAGLIALWVKKTFKIPYVITEHWGIYNRIVEDNIYNRPAIMRYLLRKIFQHASGFASVSTFLGKGVSNTLLKKEFVVIPNVVDTRLFTVSDTKYDRFSFLHVSNMVSLKNVEGIIRAFDAFQKQTGSNAQLILVGRENQQAIAMTKALNQFGKSIFFRGEVPYAEVAREMQLSHIFLLNSRIENSPCVIGEALCCGLPVVATSVGGVPELLQSGSGFLVPPGDQEQLVTAMRSVWEQWTAWDTGQIASEAAKRFSYHAIGAAIHRFYTTN